LTAGEFAGEVATTIARLDRDAAARLKRARAGRRVWARQLEDGMGYLGLTHDWLTIQAIHDAVRKDGHCLQLARGGTGAVADGEDDTTADACRADALAARVLGTVADDGTVSWDRENVAVTVNVVMDLDTLRGESDQIAILDGQPVPGQSGREVAAFATWWRRLVTDPVDGHLLDYGRTTYLPDKLRRYVLARDGGCRTPHCTNRAESRIQLDHALEFPGRAERRPQLRRPLHHMSQAQDHRPRRHHRLHVRRLLHLDHRLGPEHPHPAPLGPAHRAGPTTGRTGTTDTRRPATSLIRRSSCGPRRAQATP